LFDDANIGVYILLAKHFRCKYTYSYSYLTLYVMSIKERIQQYANIKGISIYQLEKDAGMSKSSWNRTKNISSEACSNLVSIYTDISPEWLLTGLGEMLKKPTRQDVSGNVSNLEVEKSFLEKEFFYLKEIRDKNANLIEAMEKIEEKDKEILRLKAEIEAMRGRLESKQGG
jgi:peptidase S24-like protein